MGVIVKFPDGRQEEKNCVSMYHVVNGTDYIVFETDKKENENKIVGVSYKPQNASLFTNPINTDTDKAWDATKKVLVDDIHDRKDEFVYVKPSEEILVTENFMHELALREANYKKLEENYQGFLKAEEEKQSVANPFEQPIPEPEAIQASEAPMPEAAPSTIPEPVPVAEISPVFPADAPSIDTPKEGSTELANEKAVKDNIINFPGVEKVNTPLDVNSQNIEPQPSTKNEKVQDTPAVETTGVVEEAPSALESIEQKPSIVSQSYMETANQLINQVREVTDKYIKNMEEMKDEIGRQLEEARKINDLAKQTFDNAQKIMSSQNQESIKRDLTKAA